MRLSRSFRSVGRLERQILQSRRFSGVPRLLMVRLKLEEWGYLDTWRKSLRTTLINRLEHPRFGFPGVLDRAPPPPKTLHWRYAPVEGEYEKIRTILTWAGLHIWLIADRLKVDKQYAFLVESLYDYLYNELISCWLPQASIPSFSIKSEGKLLVDELKNFVESLEANESHGEPMIDYLSTNPLCGSRSTPEFVDYIRSQQRLLAKLEISVLIQNPPSWSWNDSLD